MGGRGEVGERGGREGGGRKERGIGGPEEAVISEGFLPAVEM